MGTLLPQTGGLMVGFEFTRQGHFSSKIQDYTRKYVSTKGQTNPAEAAISMDKGPIDPNQDEHFTQSMPEHGSRCL